MAPADFHLAQLNIARSKAPMDSEFMAGFNALLDPVNAIADASPGFVWRLQTEEGNATSLRIFGDEDQLINMCLWWAPAGHLPDIPEAEERLTHLREHGPTAHAFTFKERFPAPGAERLASA